VTYKGEPLRHGSIMFEPDETQGTSGPTAFGAIQEDGTYILSSDEAGDVAVLGSHRVGITGLDPTPLASKGGPDPEEPPRGAMQAKVQAASARPKRDEGPTFTDRAGRRYRIVVPLPLGRPDSSGIKVRVASGSNTYHFDIKEDGAVAVHQ